MMEGLSKLKFLVAVTTPKKSARLIAAAGRHARALDAEVVLLRVIPDPSKVGVIAQLISSGRPQDKANQHIENMVEQLKGMSVKASGEVRMGAVGDTILTFARELKADLIFVGASDPKEKNVFLMRTDPIVDYLVDQSDISLFVIKGIPLDSYTDPEDSDEEESQAPPVEQA
ncbi:MAG: universal stress protein [Cyanobacteria bacterium HKST-UBA02]|nr:universal stress protein [Cyanobacteria bacterium HKST-UBA02]